MDDRILKVRMLGGFVVDYGDVPVVMPDARNSKMVQLFQYLLVNRNKMVRQTELIDVLLEDEKCDNPTSTLKNIVYRLRKLLMSVGINKDVIVYKKSAYGLFGDIIYDIDVERFEQIAREVQDGEMADEARFELCLTAAEIYKGEFLKKSSAEPWVMTKAVYYQEKYVNCLVYAYSVVQKTKKYERIIAALRKAVDMYPYEEDIYLMYISCLYEMGRVKESIAKYEAVVSMLYDDLGIGPPERLRALTGGYPAGSATRLARS
jgi:DNA-binding SARP family transcriptional activator